MIMRYFKITAAIALAGVAALAAAGQANAAPGSATASTAAVAEIHNGLNVALLDGKITLQLPQEFVDQTPKDKAPQDTGVAVQLFANRRHSQVVGISTVRTVNGDANDTGESAFNKMAQGALSGLKTQFKDVKKTGQTTVMAGDHKFLRIDSEQEMKDNAMIGTLLITPYHDRVITVQVLSPAAADKEHNALVKSILNTVSFH